MTPRLWVLGDLAIDDVVTAAGTTSFGQAGGNALYAARGAAVWEDAVGVAARIGFDVPPEHAAELRDLGLETHLVDVPHPSIRHWALYETDDVRQFVMRRGSGSHHDLSIRADELPPMTSAGACHIAPMPLEIQAELVDAIHGRVEVLALDPHDEYLEGREDDLAAILPRVTVFLPSRREAEIVFGRDDPEAAALAFGAMGADVVAIKLGTEGSIVTTGERATVHVPAIRSDVVDPTGAGDAYCGGFTAAYMASRDPLLAACRGTVSASLIVETRGATAPMAHDRTVAEARLAQLLERVGSHQPSSRMAQSQDCL